MIDQLKESIKVDYRVPKKPKKISGAKYKQECIELEERNITLCIEDKEAIAKEYQERTDWVRELQKSILLEPI